MKLHRAIEYAAVMHDGQRRKHGDIPYIAHIAEVVCLLAAEGAAEEVLIAGALHDVVEDTPATAEDVRELFGDRVAELVCAESEDKSLTWQQRKDATVERLYGEERAVKMITCADKVSNLKSIYGADEAIWSKFHGSREKIRVYYGGIIDALKDLDGTKLYSELKKYYGLVFGE